MKIKLPYVETIETLCLPKDFESRVKESFKRFTEGTNGDYTHHDKLLYIDNLRKHYLRNDISTEDAVKQIIADKLQAGERDLDEIITIAGQELNEKGFRADDIQIRDADTLLEVSETSKRAVILVAAWLGDARLIDNKMVELA